MKTEQFQYVIELYKTGSISKAAKKFYMSRPRSHCTNAPMSRASAAHSARARSYSTACA